MARKRVTLKWHHMANHVSFHVLRDRLAGGRYLGQRSCPFLSVVTHGRLTHTQTYKHNHTHIHTERHPAGLGGEEQRWSGRRRAAAACCWRWGSSACTVNMKRGMDPLHPLSLVQFLLCADPVPVSLSADCSSLAQPLLTHRIALQSTEQVVVRDVYVGRHWATGGEDRKMERE